ncbi:MAG TPA: hypothetical protein PLM33_11180, partial [Acidobacteriota bacterium]|nr:hypothetical protein [Acidobacteriota bacterium]
NRLSAVYRNLTHNATPEQAAQGVVEVSIAFRLSIGISLELYCRIGKGGVMSVSIAFRLSIGISQRALEVKGRQELAARCRREDVNPGGNI